MKRAAQPIPVAERLAALSEPVRLRLCRLLEREELSVGEVASVLQLPQSTVSRHLKVLSDGGWLLKRADGTATMYRLVLDDLAVDARALWVAVREQLGDSAELREDLRRLEAVLDDRKADSSSFFGRVAGAWDDLRTQLFGSSFTAPALLALLPREWTVADLGCGTGNAAELLAGRVRKVIAVDASDVMLRAAKKRLANVRGVEFRQGPLEHLPLKDASVDAAVCVLVLHHLDEPENATREMRRIVKPGGRVLVVDMFEHDRREYRHQMGHKHLGFSEARAKSMLERAGFVRVRVDALPAWPDSKGPSLYAATGEAPGANHHHE